MIRLQRVLVAASFAILAGAVLGCSPGEETKKEAPKSRPSQLTVLSFGGQFADAQREAYFKPYAAKTGVEVKEDSYNGEYGKLKAMVQGGNVSWDVVDVESSALERGKREGLFEPVDYGVVDKTDILPIAVDKYAVGTDLYSVSLGVNTSAFPDAARRPENWKDFWDVQRFPGKRCMKRDAKFTLEIALMADGVPADQLYTGAGLDVDRAFASLDRIKNDVSVWWTTGAQPIQLLGDGEVAMAAAFGARLWIAEHRDNKPVHVTWNQSMIDVEYWAVLKGAKAPAASFEFIAFASKPDAQAAFSKIFPLGPANRKALDLLDSKVARTLNTHPENLSKHGTLNTAWWTDNEARVQERFESWLGKGK